MRAQTRCFQLADEAATLALAARLAALAIPGTILTLKGPLAAGKTTFARGFLHALGHVGKVKSPTFTLVETYTLAAFRVHHFDLYRLVAPGELYYLGFEEYLVDGAICLIEWPERGAGFVPTPDLEITVDLVSATARTIALLAGTPHGVLMLTALDECC